MNDDETVRIGDVKELDGMLEAAIDALRAYTGVTIHDQTDALNFVLGFLLEGLVLRGKASKASTEAVWDKVRESPNQRP